MEIQTSSEIGLACAGHLCCEKTPQQREKAPACQPLVRAGSAVQRQNCFKPVGRAPRPILSVLLEPDCSQHRLWVWPSFPMLSTDSGHTLQTLQDHIFSCSGSLVMALDLHPMLSLRVTPDPQDG